MKKLCCIMLSVLSMLFLLSGCENGNNAEYSQTFFAMNTFAEITAYGNEAEDACSEIQDSVAEMEKLWSVTDENSEIFALNHGARTEVSPMTAEIVSFALEMSQKTGGALDPTVYPVLAAWGFTTGENRVPSEEEIAELLKLVGYEKAAVSGNRITLEDGMMLDLGAVAKGYATARAAEILSKHGVKSALVNFGGNVLAYGSKPDGSDWKIGVKDPVGDGIVGTLSLSDKTAVTSGKYKRFFTAPDGTVYGHIIDPKTGYPADNDLLSATIIAEDGALCDALSTALFVMGKNPAESYWRAVGGFDMILITKDGEIIITEGIEKNFRLTGNFSLSVIR